MYPIETTLEVALVYPIARRRDTAVFRPEKQQRQKKELEIDGVLFFKRKTNWSVHE